MSEVQEPSASEEASADPVGENGDAPILGQVSEALNIPKSAIVAAKKSDSEVSQSGPEGTSAKSFHSPTPPTPSINFVSPEDNSLNLLRPQWVRVKAKLSDVEGSSVGIAYICESGADCPNPHDISWRTADFEGELQSQGFFNDNVKVINLWREPCAFKAGIGIGGWPTPPSWSDIDYVDSAPGVSLPGPATIPSDEPLDKFGPVDSYVKDDGRYKYVAFVRNYKKIGALGYQVCTRQTKSSSVTAEVDAPTPTGYIQGPSTVNRGQSYTWSLNTSNVESVESNYNWTFTYRSLGKVDASPITNTYSTNSSEVTTTISVPQGYSLVNINVSVDVKDQLYEPATIRATTAASVYSDGSDSPRRF